MQKACQPLRARAIDQLQADLAREDLLASDVRNFFIPDLFSAQDEPPAAAQHEELARPAAAQPLTELVRANVVERAAATPAAHELGTLPEPLRPPPERELWVPKDALAHDVFIAPAETREGRRMTALAAAWGKSVLGQPRQAEATSGLSRYAVRQAKADAVYTAGPMHPSPAHANSRRQSSSKLALTRQRIEALDELSKAIDASSERDDDLRNLLAWNVLPRTQDSTMMDGQSGGGSRYRLEDLLPKSALEAMRQPGSAESR